MSQGKGLSILLSFQTNLSFVDPFLSFSVLFHLFLLFFFFLLLLTLDLVFIVTVGVS